jgi:hypothetical protein
MLVAEHKIIHNTEDRAYYHQFGEKQECEFVEIHPHLKYIINPEKSHPIHGKYAIDLEQIQTGVKTDLKCQFTPFYTAAINYPHIIDDSKNAVTFNVKDRRRYAQKQLESIDGLKINIIFWTRWNVSESYGCKIDAVDKVFLCSFDDLTELCTEMHEYEKRKNLPQSDLNSRESFVLNITNPIFKQLN